MSLNTFTYSGQIRRFIIQFVRIMSRFQVEFGQDRNGNTALQQVPVIYGDSSSQAASIIMGNSENTLPTVPCIAVYISALDYDRARVQEPYHVSKMNIRERSYDAATDTWGNTQGDAFTVERFMPVPYKLTLKVDIWTSNTTQKLQLLEQMLPLFNPALEIQSTDNYIDWTSLSAIYLQNSSWTSRSIPAGGATTIDIAGLTFELPIWISLPAKVKQLGVIKRIIADVLDANGNITNEITDMGDATVLARRVMTPLSYGLLYMGNTVRLIDIHNIVSASANTVAVSVGDTYSWKSLFERFGARIENGISQLRLEQPNGSTVVGTVSTHPTDDTLLLFTQIADTTPANTLAPVTAVIDPFNMPVDASYLNAPVGTRYLILADIGSVNNVDAAQAWHGADGSDLVAKENDIIEFNGVKWFVAFTAAAEPDVKYTTNLKSGLQFKWMPDSQSWSKSVEGQYKEGDWTLVLTAL
jgi:hypothetical protein